MRLQGTALRERLLTEIAFIGADAGVGSRVPLQVEGVVEALSAKRAEVSLHVRVAFHVSVQQTLQSEVLRADSADKLPVLFLSRRRCGRCGLLDRHMLVVIAQSPGHILNSQRILDSMPAVDEF